MLKIGEDAPDFSLLDQNRETVTGGEHRGKQVVLAFFPAAFTGVCEEELCTFNSMRSDLNQLNAQVIGISVDAPFSNNAFAEANNFSFPLLSDYTRSTVAAYGVALDDFAGMQGYTAAQRSVFIVDADGNLKWSWIADDPGQMPDFDAIRAALQ
jgi:peroxiredoxin